METELRFAPFFLLSGGEAYAPWDPDSFIARSRFRRHVDGGTDLGYNRVSGVWDRNDKREGQYYGVPVGLINGITLMGGKNRRPRDGNAVANDQGQYFLQPDNNLEGQVFSGSPPCFCRTWFSGATLVIQYWLFFNYSQNYANFNHQGDWERVAVFLEDNKPISVSFKAHNSDPYRVPWKDVEKEGERVVVFVAKGSHATYAKKGKYPHHIVATDVADGAGPVIDAARNLKRLEYVPWRDYAGAWGEVGGVIYGDGTTGPWARGLSHRSEQFGALEANTDAPDRTPRGR